MIKEQKKAKLKIQQTTKNKKPLSNAVTRVIVAALAIPGLLTAAYFGKIWFFSLAAGIGLISYYEFAKFSASKQIKANMSAGLIAVLFFCYNQYNYLFDNFYFLMGFLVIVSIIELFRNKGSAIMNLGATVFGALYTGLFAAALIGIRETYPRIDGIYEKGGWIIISILASIWVCDSAAYYGGTALGKHKLFPRVSPKKSWEGSAFGFVFAVLTMAAFKLIFPDILSWSGVLIVGIVVGTIGQLGDLVESLFKRDAGVKDSSNLIPGHGGIFDRFDSLLLTAPVIFLYLRYIDR